MARKHGFRLHYCWPASEPLLGAEDARPCTAKPLAMNPLCCLHVALRPRERFRYEGHPGKHLHAALVNLIRAVDEAAYEATHQGAQPRGFAIGPVLMPDGGYLASGAECDPRENYWFRVGCADGASSAALVAGLERGGTMELGRLRWEIAHCEFEERGEPASYADLRARARRVGHFGLRLLSPTFFRFAETGATVLPTPALIFRSLVMKWEGLEGAGDLRALSSTNVTDLATRAVAVTGLELTMAEYGAPPQLHLGVTGEVRMHVTGPLATRELVKDLNLLVDLARYVGIGAKTSWGCGQAVRIAG